MKALTIDTENYLTALTSRREIAECGEGAVVFSSAEELSKLAENWSGARLVDIWNSLPDVVPVRRFASRKVAVTRIWNSIQQLQSVTGGQVRTMASKGAFGNKRAGTSARKSKTARVIALLQKPQGATLRAIMRATGWQAHSVRGFVSRNLRKKMGLNIQSFKLDGERVYALKNKTSRRTKLKAGPAAS